MKKNVENDEKITIIKIIIMTTRIDRAKKMTPSKTKFDASKTNDGRTKTKKKS